MAELRTYQHDAIQSLRRSLSNGGQRPILVSPTGSGKTIMARGVIEGALAKDKRVLFLAPRRELIRQASRTLADVDHGIVMAGVEPHTAPVQIASWDTLRSWISREKIDPLPADVLIVDEAHLSLAPTYRKLMAEHYSEIPVVGLTATPARSDGSSLGDWYDDLVEAASVRELIDQGYLVEPVYYAPTKPDLEGLRVVRGDYETRGISNRFDQPNIVGDVVSNWCRIASDRQTVVFAATVAHARHLRDRFREIGVSCEIIHSQLPLDERQQVLDGVESGEIQVVTNVDVLSYGWDSPRMSCAVLARPTKSIVRYMQVVGRVLRPAPGKSDAVVIDHGGVVDELGFVDEDQPWSLQGKERVQERKQRTAKASEAITCGGCGFVYQRQKLCPQCGWQPPAKTKAPEYVDGDLVEVDKDKRRRNRNWSVDDKAAFFGELKGFAARKQYKQGWAAHKYREKFGVWPNDPRIKHAGMREPSQETLSWITSRNIARAKAKQKQEVA